MKENEIQDELTSIRSLMERSSKFISLSGLSGVLAGVYALIGVAIAYHILNDDKGIWDNGIVGLIALIIVAVCVLAASIVTGIILTIRKAKRKGQNPWGRTSMQLLFNLTVPLLTGGILSVIFISHGYIASIASTTLIFYGLALVNASNVTYNDIKYLGIIDIVLGLLAACLPGYGLLFWAVGFGVLHIVYGSIMYLKYDR